MDRSVAPRVAALALVAGMLAAAALAGGPAAAAAGGSTTLRLGYFPNVTHAPALVGVQGGGFQQALGPGVNLKLFTFNAGPAATEALLSDTIDAAYLGPNPAITGFLQSHGAVKVVAGAASGGAFLVVKPTITQASDLKGKVVATPQLGNTQDVALRTWLKRRGLTTDVQGGGDVSVRPEDNAVTVQAFQQNQIAGAWVPEPYATRLEKAGGHVLVDERTLWPNGRFATTELVVRTDYLKAHRDVVRNLIAGQVAAIDLIQTDPAQAQQLVGRAIQSATGTPLAPDLIASSFASMTFTNDPLASSVRTAAKNAKALGLLPSTNLNGLFDTSLLNGVLKAQGKPPVPA